MSAMITQLPQRKPRALRFFRWLWRHPAITLGGLIVGGIVLVGIFAPLITRHDPYAQDLIDTLLPPSADHLFGTDDYGRDIFARVIYGARVSIVEVVLSVGLAMIVGIPLGVMAGMAGRYVDMMIMWFMDMLFAFPGIVLAILVVSILGGGLINLLIAISLFAIPVYARLSRNLTLGLKQMEYVEAAQSLGLSRYRIIVHYILRNAVGPLIVQSTLTAGTVILAAASLSFLGLGVQPPMSEWGTMMSDGRNFLGINIYLSLFPGLAIMLTVLGFNVLGDGLRDLLDTRS
ncbi:ABC transporter permease [Hafnia psychrotolerans]|uniref:Glutathione ABC transporter permease GsiD n=1 Tax=Hafnia psychrotolerans TaxID=1477018 RepID=A0ABQ1G3J7_9GAMM|nr:ABC transporter permease [Hafnia psychrotolerans]GGA36843.1 glutathione ABC transporter permease GsiD [Hafnia psychrotolerans]